MLFLLEVLIWQHPPLGTTPESPGDDLTSSCFLWNLLQFGLLFTPKTGLIVMILSKCQLHWSFHFIFTVWNQNPIPYSGLQSIIRPLPHSLTPSPSTLHLSAKCYTRWPYCWYSSAANSFASWELWLHSSSCLEGWSLDLNRITSISSFVSLSLYINYLQRSSLTTLVGAASTLTKVLSICLLCLLQSIYWYQKLFFHVWDLFLSLKLL